MHCVESFDLLNDIKAIFLYFNQSHMHVHVKSVTYFVEMFMWGHRCISVDVVYSSNQTYITLRHLYSILKNFTLYVYIIYIVNAGKTTHVLLNFTLNKIKLAQIMNNRVYFVRNTCYFDVQ